MSVGTPIVLGSDTGYATKDNILYPHTKSQAQATAAEASAELRLEDSLPSEVTVTVAAGAIELAPE